MRPESVLLVIFIVIMIVAVVIGAVLDAAGALDHAVRVVRLLLAHLGQADHVGLVGGELEGPGAFL